MIISYYLTFCNPIPNTNRQYSNSLCTAGFHFLRLCKHGNDHIVGFSDFSADDRTADLCAECGDQLVVICNRAVEGKAGKADIVIGAMGIRSGNQRESQFFRLTEGRQIFFGPLLAL